MNILLIILVTCIDHINVTLRKHLFVVVLLDRYLIQTDCEGPYYFLSHFSFSSSSGQSISFWQRNRSSSKTKHMSLAETAVSYSILASEAT